MPYSGTSDLPESVRSHLPERAQEIYVAAFNNAWKEYDHDEARSHKVAWAAVKHSYEKNASTGQWHSKIIEMPSSSVSV
jgi:cation transport regulator